nr:hypothetical protein [Bacillus sp. DNRA2]
MRVKESDSGRVENQVFSNRVARAEFDENWKTTFSSTGYVIYVALCDKAELVVLLDDGTRKLLVFKKGGEVIVGSGGVSHYSKPHYAIIL